MSGITGYRQLTDEEIGLVNEVKATEAQCAALLSKLSNLENTGKREIELALTNLQQYSMWASRSITQPTSPNAQHEA